MIDRTQKPSIHRPKQLWSRLPLLHGGIEIFLGIALFSFSPFSFEILPYTIPQNSVLAEAGRKPPRDGVCVCLAFASLVDGASRLPKANHLETFSISTGRKYNRSRDFSVLLSSFCRYNAKYTRQHCIYSGTTGQRLLYGFRPYSWGSSRPDRGVYAPGRMDGDISAPPQTPTGEDGTGVFIEHLIALCSRYLLFEPWGDKPKSFLCIQDNWLLPVWSEKGTSGWRAAGCRTGISNMRGEVIEA